MHTLRLSLFAFSLFLALAAVPARAADGPRAGEVDPATGKTIKYWVAPMDPTYIREEPGQSPMGMDLVPVYVEEGPGEKEPTSTIRIDPVTIQNMGVRIAPVRRDTLSRSIRALGTVTYDERRMYTVTSKFDGWVERLYVSFVGEGVKKGQPLMDIYSPDLVTAQEEYLLALRQVRELGGSDYQQVREGARRLLDAAHRRLLNWDMSEAQIARLAREGKARRTLTVYSPATGVVTKKDAYEGHFVKAGMHQYEIADISRVWVDAEIYEYELPFVSLGMTARMELSYLPGKNFQGKVFFVYPYLNPKTRTATLRLTFDNSGGELKPAMYANVYLESEVGGEVLVVPQEAVIDSGERTLVFVDRGRGRFEPREVRLGAEGADNTYQVLSGLSEGENIVVSAQFMLDSESRLREAVAKLLEARSGGSDAAGDPDLNMDDLKMDDLKMDGPAGPDAG
ncbi:efflux RND transporter periplasmic adaptor subunit [Desulfocurvus sp. DL9XJH121]